MHDDFTIKIGLIAISISPYFRALYHLMLQDIHIQVPSHAYTPYTNYSNHFNSTCSSVRKYKLAKEN